MRPSDETVVISMSACWRRHPGLLLLSDAPALRQRPVSPGTLVNADRLDLDTVNFATSIQLVKVDVRRDFGRNANDHCRTREDDGRSDIYH